MKMTAHEKYLREHLYILLTEASGVVNQLVQVQKEEGRREDDGSDVGFLTDIGTKMTTWAKDMSVL